ncbi:MAG TPA: T3SS effector HopA1 family protein, partial [Isosphaeraceae bacterium]|nr:T3SS effector HopA1 family protein [Isosphaeraceae bacterium]
MNLIHDDLFTVLDAIEIESPVRYSLLGELRTLDAADPLEPGGLVAVLAEEMYARLYVRPSFPQPRSRADVLAQRDFMAGLSAANSGRGTCEPGWKVRRIEEDGRALAEKNEVEFRVPALGWRGVRDGEIGPGAACKVAVPKERRYLIWGFYYAVGDAEEETYSGDAAVEPMVRFYWHLLSSVAAPFVAAATSALNAARIPFLLKVLSDPNDFHRADSGVIFVRRHYLPRLSEMVAGIHSELRAGLRGEVPLFTRRLADGLGWAEDPANAMSFGQHRCQLAARASWESFARGELDRDARALALAQAFRDEGLDPLRPYLRLDSPADDAVLPPFPPPVSIQISVDRFGPDFAAEASRADGSTLSSIDAAARIGEALCRSAYWDRQGQSCNWMGRSIAEIAQYGGPITPTVAACGPDLYAGSAGIGLFLAQLHALTGDLAFARTSLGAIDRSIRQLASVPSTEAASPLSFHCGHLGVAYAARRVGLLTTHIEPVLQAVTILDRVINAVSSPHELDVIGGNAGAIPILLLLGGESGLERCHDLAIALGEELCRTAVHQVSGWAWEPEAASGPGMGPVPQTGLSHGAAGMGMALFELYGATGRRDFLEIARGAFAFEDALFDP